MTISDTADLLAPKRPRPSLSALKLRLRLGAKDGLKGGGCCAADERVTTL